MPYCSALHLSNLCISDQETYSVLWQQILFAIPVSLNLAATFILTSMEEFHNYVIGPQTGTRGALYSKYRQTSRQGRYGKSKKSAVQNGNVWNLN
jgi:hypothetical protein